MVGVEHNDRERERVGGVRVAKRALRASVAPSVSSAPLVCTPFVSDAPLVMCSLALSRREELNTGSVGVGGTTDTDQQHAPCLRHRRPARMPVVHSTRTVGVRVIYHLSTMTKNTSVL